jgi:hypothetical protein
MAQLHGLDRDHIPEYALISVAGYGCRGVVELLLSKDPALSVREPIWNNTALEAAESSGHPRSWRCSSLCSKCPGAGGRSLGLPAVTRGVLTHAREGPKAAKDPCRIRYWPGRSGQNHRGAL